MTTETQTRRPRTGAPAQAANGTPAIPEPEITLPLSETTLDSFGDEDDDGGTAEEDEDEDTGSGDEEEGDESRDPVIASADAEAAAARREADREALREEVRAEERAKTVAAQEVAAAEARTERVKGSYAQTVRTINAGLKNQPVAVSLPDGDRVEVSLGELLTDAQLQTLVFDHLGSYNNDVAEAQAIEVYGSLGKAAQGVLPREIVETFAKDFTGKPVDEWLSGFGEAYAEHSKWGKTQAVESKASIKAAEARGVRIGKGMDPEQPTQENTNGRAPKRTFAQLQAGYGAGTLTGAEEADYHRQDAERKKNR